MKSSSLLLVSLLSTASIGPAALPAAPATESREAFDQRMAWWRDASFGMFIHWGPYAKPAGVYQGKEIAGIGEWIMDKAAIPIPEYEKFSREFSAEDFDADKWVRIAREAGMKYIIITSKHHDGFCLWDSMHTTYDAVDFAAARRDLLAELKTACDRQGMILGFYHSIMDWHHPDAQAPNFPTYNSREKTNPNFQRYVETQLIPQVRELVTRYHPAVLWFDGEWIPDWTHEHGVSMYNMLRELDPSIIVNNRVDKGRQGMKGMNRDDMQYAGDFGTPEQEILEGTSAHDWESCMTMNDTWGFKSGDHNWKSAETLVHNLVSAVAKGGNYLLNVGPTAKGVIPPESVERLAAVGRWLRVNGEAIYATDKLARYHEGDTTFFTRSRGGSTIYTILTAWPTKELRLTQVAPSEGAEVRLLGRDKPLAWRRDGATTVIDLPSVADRPEGPAWTLKFGGTEAR